MPLELTITHSLLLASVTTGTLATTGLLVRAVWRRTPTDALLALLLALPTLKGTERVLYFAGWAEGHVTRTRWLDYFPWYLGLAVGPAYYLYFRSLTNQEFRWRPIVWHLWPGLLRIGLAALAALYDLFWLGGPPAGTLGPAAAILDELHVPLAMLGYALLLGYLLRVRTDYRRYYRYLDDHFSNQERLRFQGLRNLLIIQVIWVGLGVGFTAVDAVSDFSSVVQIIAFALRDLLIFALAAVGLEANYAAATSPLQFEPDAAPAPLPESPPLLPAPVPSTEILTPPAPVLVDPVSEELPKPVVELPADLLPYREKLLCLMEEQRPWLEPELNLAELAHRLALHPVLLSKVINIGCGQSFSDFVNTYRVQETRRKMTDPAFKHYSLIGIALESGFSSKSTFNRVFKKITGSSPGDIERPIL